MAHKNDLAEEYNIHIDPDVFNDAYFEYLYTINRYEVYWGGSSSGKSVFVAQKLALQLTLYEGRNLICLRKQGTDARDSVYPVIHTALFQLGLLQFWDVVEHPMPRLTHKQYGNVIAFSGLDSAEDIKSITFKKGRVLTDIWYEEVTGEKDIQNLRELDRRLRGRGYKKRIIFSFNPIHEKHPIRDYLWHELADNGADIVFLHTTYVNNKFLDEEDIATIERFKATDPYSWQVYGLGFWGTTGMTVFDVNKVNERLKFLKQHREESGFYKAKVRFLRDPEGNVIRDSFSVGYDPQGEITIFKEPEPGRPYAAALDTAGGGVDYHALQICDNITGEQVAVFHSQKMPIDCVYQVIGLIKYYNDALIAPEINFGTYHLDRMLEMKYYRIYRRDASPDRMDLKIEPKYGFHTGPENRRKILSDMKEYTDEHMNMINDEETLEEMLSFTRQKAKVDVVWAAEPGAHDDLVMAYAIMLVCRGQQTRIIAEPKKPLVGFWLPEELDFAVESGKISRHELNGKKKEMLSKMGVMSSTIPEGDEIPW